MVVRALTVRLGALAIVRSCLATSAAVAGRDQLVIGISQFPYTLHPGIESMMAKSLVPGLTRRPLTVYDADWKLVCMLCTDLPTVDNGLAVPETTPDGKSGIAVTFTLRPDAVWGDGTPVTTRDIVFTWQVGRHPETPVVPKELYRRLYAVNVRDDRTFTFHFDKLTFDYNAMNNFSVLLAHMEEAAFADPANYTTHSRYQIDPTSPGLWAGP